MIKRLLWLGIGLAVGGVVAHQIGKAVRAYSPAGVAGAAGNYVAGLIDSVRDFAADVQEGMSVREAEISEAFARGVTLGELTGDEGFGNENGRDQAEVY